jgi:hypothetical protein
MPRGYELAALLLGANACATPAPLPVSEDGWGPTEDRATGDAPLAPAPRARTIPRAERKRWSGADGLASLRTVDLRVRSEHLDGRFERTVLVNELAGSYERLGPGIHLPKGALVVQRHHIPGSEATAVYFVMEKVADGDTWRFLVVDSELKVAAQAHLDTCARCHVEAPYAGLFGIAAAPAYTP